MIVRTTMRPDDPIDVDGAEYTDLSRQGLLMSDPQPPATTPAAAQIPPAPAVQPEPDPQEKPA